MEKKATKKVEEALAEIYRNAQLAIESIVDILPQVDDSQTKAELETQHEEYERFSAKAAMLARDKNIEIKEPNKNNRVEMTPEAIEAIVRQAKATSPVRRAVVKTLLSLRRAFTSRN